MVLASTSMTRSVTSACGLPGHGSARAAKGAMAATSAMAMMRIISRLGVMHLTATANTRQACLDDRVYELIICASPRPRRTSGAHLRRGSACEKKVQDAATARDDDGAIRAQFVA